MDIFYIECLVLWIFISGYIGSLNITTACVAAGFWIFMIWLGRWLPPDDLASWVMVLLPVAAPFVGHFIGRAARRYFRMRQEESDRISAQLEQQRDQARALAADKAKMDFVPNGENEVIYWANHVLLTVRDLPKALTFYRDILAMTPLPEHGLDESATILTAGRLLVVLSEAAQTESAALQEFSTVMPQLGLGVIDLATVKARLLEHGYSVESENVFTRIVVPAHHNAEHQIYVLDPDGHTILLSEHLSPGAIRHRAALRRKQNLQTA